MPSDQLHARLTLRGGGWVVKSAGEKIADCLRDLGSMRLQREMTGVEKADLRLGNVAPEPLGAWRKEERIVLAPHRQKRRLVRAEVVLERGVQCDVALVVAEEVELDFIRTGTGPNRSYRGFDRPATPSSGRVHRVCTASEWSRE